MEIRLNDWQSKQGALGLLVGLGSPCFARLLFWIRLSRKSHGSLPEAEKTVLLWPGEPASLYPKGASGVRAEPATCLERVVEFSQICCRDLGELLVPQAGFDVMLHITCPKPARNCREGGSPTDLPDCHPGNSIVY